ncbi:MAG: ISAs1 family transposase [Anaerolineae bacterium]
MLCGADSWVGIEMFGKAKETWFQEFLELEHGIPSHDTFGNVFAKLDHEAFQTRFIRWVESVTTVTKGQVVAIDGKTARGSHGKANSKVAIHGVVLGQRKVGNKTNEITAIPKLLRLLNVTGYLVTIDAMGCQTAISQAIRDEKADYLLCVKDNQSNLRQDIEDRFVHGDQQNFQNMTMNDHETVSKTSGRVEIRRCWAISDPLAMEHIRHYDGWADLQTLVRVQRETRTTEKTTHDTHLPAECAR